MINHQQTNISTFRASSRHYPKGHSIFKNIRRNLFPIKYKLKKRRKKRHRTPEKYRQKVYC